MFFIVLTDPQLSCLWAWAQEDAFFATRLDPNYVEGWVQLVLTEL